MRARAGRQIRKVDAEHAGAPFQEST